MENEILTTNESPNTTGRFNETPYLISKLKVIDETTEKFYWEKLKNEILLKDYSLNANKFEVFEIFDFENDYEIVKDKLAKFLKEPEQIIISWFTNEKSLLIDSPTFIEYWEEFFSSSADDLVIFSKNFNWVIYIAHYECLQLGYGMKNS